jgi:hypothetical protein
MADRSQAELSGPAFTEEQRRVAATLDVEVAELVRLGCDDLSIFAKMAERGLPQFRWLLETTTLDGLNALCTQFDGFSHYAQLLERISQSMASSVLDAAE